MKIKAMITSALLLLFCTGFVSAQKNFSLKELNTIYHSVDSLMEMYQQYSTFTDDMESLSDDYISGFQGLFTSPDALIINDLDYTKKTAAKISVSKYIEYVKSWYSRGLGVTATVTEKASPRLVNNMYVMALRVSKDLSGYYKNQQMHKYKGEQYFAIEFDPGMTTFRIKGIDVKVIANTPKMHI